ncbi:MAG: phosphatidate cytidylyltransferase [Synergistaceae bacterium]|jgi:phosphatidate cytidylyltransferase|nr:phosphatidate cytidylyltransferase [Synergistaceae bacterium]
MGLHKPPQGARIRIPDEGVFNMEYVSRIVGSVVVLVCVMAGIMYESWAWNIVASVIAIGSLAELYRLMSTKYRLSRGWGLSGAVLMLAAVSMRSSFSLLLVILAIVAMLVLFTEVVRRQSMGHSYALFNLGGTLAGLIYVVLPWCFTILMRMRPDGQMYLLTIFFCTWSCDVGAYIVGTSLGSTHLCDRVSPHKTLEGFIAGVVSSTVCGSILPVVFGIEPFPWVILGALCGVAGQLGDLAESVLKREAGVKDTGHAIPGHGGFLDRFDSILINATLIFFIIEIIS